MCSLISFPGAPPLGGGQRGAAACGPPSGPGRLHLLDVRQVPRVEAGAEEQPAAADLHGCRAAAARSSPRPAPPRRLATATRTPIGPPPPSNQRAYWTAPRQPAAALPLTRPWDTPPIGPAPSRPRPLPVARGDTHAYVRARTVGGGQRGAAACGPPSGPGRLHLLDVRQVPRVEAGAEEQPAAADLHGCRAAAARSSPRPAPPRRLATATRTPIGPPPPSNQRAYWTAPRQPAAALPLTRPWDTPPIGPAPSRPRPLPVARGDTHAYSAGGSAAPQPAGPPPAPGGSTCSTCARFPESKRELKSSPPQRISMAAGPPRPAHRPGPPRRAAWQQQRARPLAHHPLATSAPIGRRLGNRPQRCP
ncbi:PREDICTED: basic salivary proline-rich protein 2-like [Calidris pugnax]|uniref:basic salivary proline-rich protein 2-like n=1 Tax=Calidris pugnax TaxID=198806 RepID=UPI00071CF7FF|nr:PREDICTED: basic salivary proline-rich protein 2-like [Calidris pugnax]